MNNNVADSWCEPPVVLDAATADRLQDLAMSSLRRVPEVANRLLDEIERAIVLTEGSVPSNVVNIGSTVTFHDDTAGRDRTVTLSIPQDADIAAHKISVLTPIGAALIGLAEGASITWETRGGEVRRLTILKVEGPAAAPEATTGPARPEPAARSSRPVSLT